MNASTIPPRATHDVTNQSPPYGGHNAWTTDPVLRAAVAREGGAWIEARAHAMGEMVTSERMQKLAYQANRYTPELRTHDRSGHRIDMVEYHPAYHELMSIAFGAGLHSLAWTVDRDGVYVARAALNYLWNQGENGVACPVTMCFAGVHVLRNAPDLAVEWEPKIVAEDYDPRPLPIAEKRAATLGMAMTEKQGGSDLRSNTTRAEPIGEGEFLLTGHKWFCSAPMSDGFLTLARAGPGLTCLFVPRSLPDGTRNRFHIQRLKDKVGNRSNASSEIEYDGTWARVVGVQGRGIATIIEMAHLTRFDIVVANAGMMRAGLAQALHHCEHRSAFGKRLVEQPLMQNVLADLALECEAATLLAFRLARAFDAGREDERERQLARIVTPVAKYWVCKRINALAVEAMECLGGSGYVEESPLARLYREAPVNGIWEGSGNVISLDVLRSMAREPACGEAFFAELADAAAVAPKLAQVAEALKRELADTATLEVRARRVVEEMAVALQAALMVRHAPNYVADAFIATRLEGDWGTCFGTLPTSVDCADLIRRIRASN